MVNISSELQLLHSLANLVGLDDIKNTINFIQKDFNQINKRFTQIIQQNSQVSNNFLTETLNEVKLKFQFFYTKLCFFLFSLNYI